MAWDTMLQRCTNPKHAQFHDYGGRGIQVHPDLRTFAGFLAVVGERPSSKHSLDRIDNEKGYEPGNLRWATRREQALNKRSNHLITFEGKTQPLAAWAEERGIEYNTLRSRIVTYGWPLEKAMAATLVKSGRPRTRPRQYT